jgi:hemolysin D
MSTPAAQSNAAEASPPRAPFIELCSRYKAVLQAAWAAREELAGPKRMADERAFLPAAMALQETPPHPAPRRAAIAICAFFTLALIWALVGQLDIVAVAQGRVVVSDRTKTLQPLETSVIKAIHVRDGDRVKAGDLLIELDATTTQADSTRVTQEHSAAMSDRLRATALLKALASSSEPAMASSAALPQMSLAATRLQLAAEWQDIRAKLNKLDAEIQRRQAEVRTAEALLAKLQTTLPMAQAREKDFKALTAQGFVAEHAGQDRTRERVELERDLETAKARINETRAGLAESERSMAAYKAETVRALKDREAQADLKQAQLAEEDTKAKHRQSLTRLTAPVSGTVQQLAVHTSGGVVTPAQALLVLVPDEAEVTAEVVVENKDVGFVREGQIVEIKLDTFPFTRYGTVPGRVKTVSADAVTDEKRGAIFPATVVLDRSAIDVEGKQIRLAPGMTLAAEIKTGKRRVIDYLLSPVQQHTHESLRER